MAFVSCPLHAGSCDAEHVMVYAPPSAERTEDAIVLDGIVYTDVERLREAIAKFPRGAELAFKTDFPLSELPIGPVPHITVDALSAFCADRGVRFRHCFRRVTFSPARKRAGK